MKRTDYQKAERILYDYFYTRARAASISRELKTLDIDMHAQKYNNEARRTGGSVSDPVGSLYQTRELLQTNLEYYRNIIFTVSSFLELLAANKKQDAQILVLCYFRKLKADEAARELCMSERNLYARKSMLVKKFAKYCRNRDII